MATTNVSTLVTLQPIGNPVQVETADEDDTYSVVSDRSSFDATPSRQHQVDHTYDAPDFLNQEERNGQPRTNIYNTLTRVNSSTNTATSDIHAHSKLHELIEESESTKCGKNTLKSNVCEQYSHVMLSQSTTRSQKKKGDNTRAYEMIPQAYEIVVLSSQADKTDKETTSDLKVFDDDKYGTGFVHKPTEEQILFDDDVYLTRQAAAKHSKENYESETENNAFTQQHNTLSSETGEYAEPIRKNIKQGQSRVRDEGHYYHKLDQDGQEYDSVHNEAVVQQKTSSVDGHAPGQLQRKQANLSIHRHDPLHTRVNEQVSPNSHMSVDEESTTNVCNSKLFDDSTYEGVAFHGESHTANRDKVSCPQKEILEQDSTAGLQPPSDGGLSFTDVQEVELDEEKDFTDAAPDYSDPIDSVSVDDGMTAGHREEEKGSIYGIFDDPTYA